MKKSYQNGISENVRIRHYIMSLIYQGGTKTQRLPTSSQLAKEFGIARSTVLAALKQLSDEGYITGKRGAGVFTNPYSAKLPLKSRKLIGMLLSGGDNYYYGKAAWEALAELGSVFTDSGWNVRLLSVNLNSMNDLRAYLDKQSLSALVMVHSNTHHAHNAAKLLPTIIIGHQRDEPMPSIRFSYENSLRALRKETHFQRPMFIGEQYWMIENNFVPFWTGRRIPQSRRLNCPIIGESEFLSKLRASLEREQPDILFALPEMAQELYTAEQELGTDIPIVSWRAIPASASFHGYVFQEPYKEAAGKAALLLKEQFRDGKISSGPLEIDVPLTRI